MSGGMVADGGVRGKLQGAGTLLSDPGAAMK
jgi:hypothetical protein